MISFFATSRMFEETIAHLVNTLPPNILEQERPIDIDIVFDSGMFNGSYLVGAMKYISELEKRNIVKIHRISGCSIGSFIALLYILGKVDRAAEIHKLGVCHIREHKDFNALDLWISLIEVDIPENIHELMTDRVYLKYYDTTLKQKIVKYRYTSKEDVFETIRRSCFLPFVVNGEFMYKGCIDGMNPYRFPIDPSKKILYLDLFGLDKVKYVFTAKNETDNSHRVLSGLLDTHLFFLKGTSTSLCSYIDEWGTYKMVAHFVRDSFETIVIYLIHCILFLQRNSIVTVSDTFLVMALKKFLKAMFREWVDEYCV
jgi:hypothetical protein